MKVLPFERPLGARPSADATTFRVWAPRPDRIVLRAGGSDHELADAGLGVREVTLPLSAGQDYAFVIDGIEIPDPASRWQPAGLRGPSRVLDTQAFAWSDGGFTPPDLEDTVIYELHVGTFTTEGTFEAVIPHLAGLRELGITTLELLPVAEFPGRHGWGYDGVYLSAAHSAYGGPQGLQKLVDAAHAEGLAVLLDVVYNHVGASGAQALEAVGPHFPGAREARGRAGGWAPISRARTRRSGARRSTSTTPTAAASASGCFRAPRAGSATSTSTACGSTPSTRSSTAAPSTSSRPSMPASTRSTRRRW